MSGKLKIFGWIIVFVVIVCPLGMLVVMEVCRELLSQWNALRPVRNGKALKMLHAFDEAERLMRLSSETKRLAEALSTSDDFGEASFRIYETVESFAAKARENLPWKQAGRIFVAAGYPTIKVGDLASAAFYLKCIVPH